MVGWKLGTRHHSGTWKLVVEEWLVGVDESLTRWAMCVRPQALSGLYTTGPAVRPPFDFGDV